MPQSKQRKDHKHIHKDYIPHKKERKSIVPLAIVVCMILALGIAWFAVESYVPGLLIGLAIGALIGWVGGKEMDKAFNKK